MQGKIRCWWAFGYHQGLPSPWRKNHPVRIGSHSSGFYEDLRFSHMSS